MGRETALAGWELTWDLPRGKSQDCQEEEAAPMGLGCLAAGASEKVWKPVQLSDRLCFTMKRHKHLWDRHFPQQFRIFGWIKRARNSVTPAYSAFPLLYFPVYGQGNTHIWDMLD